MNVLVSAGVCTSSTQLFTDNQFVGAVRQTKVHCLRIDICNELHFTMGTNEAIGTFEIFTEGRIY